MKSQTSIPQHNPLRALSVLGKTVALPNEYPPIRYPSYPSLERTAVLGFSVPTTVGVDSIATSTTKLMLARQAAWPAFANIIATQLITTVTYTSALLNVGSGGGSAPSGYDAQIDGSMMTWSVGTRSTGIPPGVIGAIPIYQYPVIGRDMGIAGRVWTYVPDKCVLLWNIHVGTTSAAADITGNLSYYIWQSPNEWLLSAQALNVGATYRGGTSPSIAATAGGMWVSPVEWVASQTAIAADLAGPITITAVVSTGLATYTASTSSSGSYTATATATTIFYPIAAPAEFANSTLPWYSSRVTAVSMLGTNVTQVQSKGGTALCGRVAPSVINPWSVTPTYINTLHPAEKSFLPLETGVYTYVPPSQDMLEWRDYTSVTTGAVSGFTSIPACPMYDLSSNAMVHIIFLSGSTAIETIAVTVDWHIEFRTSSALFNIAMCTTPLEVLHQAQIAMSDAGFFFDNPDHKSILSRVMSAVKKYSPYVLNAINPNLYSAGVGMYRTITRANHTTVPTTTARKAGWNGPARGRLNRRRGKRPMRYLPPPNRRPPPRIAAPAQPPKKRGGLQMYLDSRK